MSNPLIFFIAKLDILTSLSFPNYWVNFFTLISIGNTMKNVYCCKKYENCRRVINIVLQNLIEALTLFGHPIPTEYCSKLL